MGGTRTELNKMTPDFAEDEAEIFLSDGEIDELAVLTVRDPGQRTPTRVEATRG